MIKKITFEEIKPYWQILWPFLDVEKQIPFMYLPECKYVSKAYRSVKSELLYDKIPSIFLGYAFNNEYIGVLNGYKTSNIHFRTRGLWVNEKYRKMGIATNLMRYLENFANESDCRFLWSIPRKTALGFYEKYGFKQTSKFIRKGNNCYALKRIYKRE